jgi:hypothetical protein
MSRTPGWSLQQSAGATRARRMHHFQTIVKLRAGVSELGSPDIHPALHRWRWRISEVHHHSFRSQKWGDSPMFAAVLMWHRFPKGVSPNLPSPQTSPLVERAFFDARLRDATGTTTIWTSTSAEVLVVEAYVPRRGAAAAVTPTRENVLPNDPQWPLEQGFEAKSRERSDCLPPGVGETRP